MSSRFPDFASFYPFYLSQHRDGVCRTLHVLGVFFSVGLTSWCLVQGHYVYAVLAPLSGYAFAWVGHFGFEKNRPATFTYPAYSFRGDLHMTVDMLRGRLPWRGELDERLCAYDAPDSGALANEP